MAASRPQPTTHNVGAENSLLLLRVQAVLVRRYDAAGLLQGWNLALYKISSLKCSSLEVMGAPAVCAANSVLQGRVYTVRVCVKVSSPCRQFAREGP